MEDKDLQSIYKRLQQSHITFRTAPFENIDKKLRALEIIKNKEVNVYFFKYAVQCEEEDGIADGFEIYNLKTLLKNEITREEYELLKEILK